MNLQKVLWSALIGTTTVIVMLLTAWGNDMTHRVNSLEGTRTTAANHDGRVDEDLKTLHQDLEEVKQLLRNKH